MYQLTALYSHPEDTDAFDKHYRGVHAPLAAKIPGLKKFTMNWPQPGPDGAKPSYYFIAVLYWNSEADFQADFAGPEVQAAVDDLPNFAAAGVDLVTGPAEAVI